MAQQNSVDLQSAHVDPVKALKAGANIKSKPDAEANLPQVLCRIVEAHGKTWVLPIPGGEESEARVYDDLDDSSPEVVSAADVTLGELLSAYQQRNPQYIGTVGGGDTDRPEAKFPDMIDAQMLKPILNPLITQVAGSATAKYTDKVNNVVGLARSKNLMGAIIKGKSWPADTLFSLSPDGRFLIAQSQSEGFVEICTVMTADGVFIPESQRKRAVFTSPEQLQAFLSGDGCPDSITASVFGAVKIERIEGGHDVQVELQAGAGGILRVYDADRDSRVVARGVIDFATDPSKPGRIYAVMGDGSVIHVLEVGAGGDISSVPTTVRAMSIRAVRKSGGQSVMTDARVNGIAFDQGGNAMVCTYIFPQGGHGSGVFSKLTGKQIFDLNTQSAFPPVVTSRGEIVLYKANGTPKVFSTDFNELDPNLFNDEEDRMVRRQVLDQASSDDGTAAGVAASLQRMLAGGQQASTGAKARRVVSTGPRPQGPKEDPRITQLKAKVQQVFDGPIDQARGNAVMLKRIKGQLDVWKAEPVYAGIPEVFADVEQRLVNEIRGAVLYRLRQELMKWRGLVPKVRTYDTMRQIEERFAKAMQKRRRIPEEFNGEELAAREALEELRQKIAREELRIKRTLIGRLERQWVAIETAFEEIETLHGLEASHSLSEVERLEGILELADDDVVSLWRRRLIALKAAKRDEIRARELQEERETQRKQERKISAIVSDIDYIDDELDARMTDEAVDEYRRTSPLVARVRQRVGELPVDKRPDLLRKLRRVFQDRKKELQTIQTVIKEDDPGYAKFGEQKFPIFVPVQPKVEAHVVPPYPGAAIGTLVFRDNYGNEWTPDLGCVPVDISDMETAEMVQLYKADAKRHLVGGAGGLRELRPLVPEMHKEWVISEQTERYLAEMARLLGKQLQRQNGILIMVGEAGTGKNVLADIWAHFTNREVFEFSCNKQTEKEDVQFSFEFDPEKGTYRLPSNVIKALQTPGAVLVFDEINTLPPGVSKLLNPLFDHRRKLIMPDGTIIRAHPTVTIIGMMNPGNYIGTTPLPQEVRSRARMMSVEYPEKRREEALMYAPLIDCLKDLYPKQIRALWDKYIDNTASPETSGIESDERKEVMEKLNRMLGAVEVLRENYRKTQTEQAGPGEEINFIFSLRDGGQVVEELDDDFDMTVGAAMVSVINPKIDDAEEWSAINTVINAAA